MYVLLLVSVESQRIQKFNDIHFIEEVPLGPVPVA